MLQARVDDLSAMVTAMFGKIKKAEQWRDIMATPKVFESEYRFCLILWRNEPVSSAELAKLCAKELDWSRTTTYTVIKRLTERGVVKNENSMITSLVSKEEVQIAEMDELLEKTFEGSLPAFIAAFAKKKKLSKEQVEEIQRIIDGEGEGLR